MDALEGQERVNQRKREKRRGENDKVPGVPLDEKSFTAELL